MAKIVDYREISLDDLVIGKGQVRTESVNTEIDYLANSIETQGLLQPIVVCQARDKNKWEILTGQRRFLAHKLLRKPTITAAILDEKVEEAEAKAISITENLIRRKLSGKELKDGLLYLYNIYGSIKDVHSATGIPIKDVRENIKYPRLIPELRKQVDDQKCDIGVALKAQDASVDSKGSPNPELALQLAGEMKQMNNAQQKKFLEGHKKNSTKPIDDAIEEAKSSANITQIVVALSQSAHSALRVYAREEQTNQGDAAATLIEKALADHGLLEV